MLVLLFRVLFHYKVSHHSTSVKVQIVGCYNNPMLLVLDNSDSPSIGEQLSQGPSFIYNTFISDSFLAL